MNQSGIPNGLRHAPPGLARPIVQQFATLNALVRAPGGTVDLSELNELNGLLSIYAVAVPYSRFSTTIITLKHHAEEEPTLWRDTFELDLSSTPRRTSDFSSISALTCRSLRRPRRPGRTPSLRSSRPCGLLPPVWKLSSYGRSWKERGRVGHMQQELPFGVDSLPLAAYAFVSGYLNAVSFTTATVIAEKTCLPKSTPNPAPHSSASLLESSSPESGTLAFDLAVQTILENQNRSTKKRANNWLSPKSNSPAITRFPSSDDHNQGTELGLRPPVQKAEDWSESRAPSRVGTPIPSGSIGHMTRTSSLVPSPIPPAYGRARLWLVVGSLFQAFLLVASAVAAMHDHTTPSTVSTTRSSPSASWMSLAQFTSLALLNVSMDFHGVMAHRMGSGLGASAVLRSLWVEFVGLPGGLGWKSYRSTRVWTIVLSIVGGLGEQLCNYPHRIRD
ncbi:transmembrane protein [Ceratobasidium sp. AG-Ba]|nr:transmembrane protein [Ceratobasidium sp. AG-Ba]